MSSAAYNHLAQNGVKDGTAVEDGKPEQEVKRTAAQPIPVAAHSLPPASYISPASPLLPLSRLLSASSASPPHLSQRSADSWRQTDGRANTKTAVASRKREGEKRAAAGRSLPLNGSVRSTGHHSTPSCSSRLVAADGGEAQEQVLRSSQDVRQVGFTQSTHHAHKGTATTHSVCCCTLYCPALPPLSCSAATRHAHPAVHPARPGAIRSVEPSGCSHSTTLVCFP